MGEANGALYLDEEPRRLVLYGGLFGAFVLVVVISLIVGVASAAGWSQPATIKRNLTGTDAH